MKKWILSGLVVAIAGAAIAFSLLWGGSDGEATAGAQAPSVRPVRTMIVTAESIDRELRATGTLRADEAVAVRSEISAKVVEIFFREGESVEAGALLVKLDDTELRAQLSEIQANLDFALREEQRQRQLLRKGTTTERQFDEAENRRKLLEAARTTLEARLAKTELRAPFSGAIGLRYVSPGSLVQPDTRVASLQRIEPLKIDFAVPERYLSDLVPNLAFEVAIAGDARRYAGSVYAREPAIEPDTRTVQLRGRVENPEGRLLPGGYAQVFLNLGSEEGVLAIPTVAVVPGRQSSIFVLEDETVHRRNVRLGRRTRDRVRILEGLEAGETIVVAGVQNIRDGERVRVVNREQVAAR